MKIESRKVGGVRVLKFEGKLTKDRGELAMGDRLRALLDAGERSFVLDFRDVPYMDSAAIGATVACLKRAREKRGQIKIVLVPGSRPAELFRLTALDRAFEIFPDEQGAVAGFD